MYNSISCSCDALLKVEKGLMSNRSIECFALLVLSMLSMLLMLLMISKRISVEERSKLELLTKGRGSRLDLERLDELADALAI